MEQEIMNSEENKNKKEKSGLNMPTAVVIAGVLIAGAILLSGGNLSEKTAEIKAKREALKLTEIKEIDHLLGNPDAKITILEFSDTECPYCKRFHQTMKRIINEYDGQVNWVYRHFPIESIHKKARTEAAATECAYELGGEDMFWKYLDKIFEITPSNDKLDLTVLPTIAEEFGLDRTSFEECLSSGRTYQKVDDDFQNGVSIGVNGTPHSLILFDGQIVPISGAQSYEFVQSTIETILKDN